jgi:hypothetical protein
LRRALGTVIRSILLVAAVGALMSCRRLSYCEARCNCNKDHSCNSNDLGFCNQSATGEELAAQELGCSKEYDALTTCQDETAACINGYWMVSTACDIQQNVYDKCMAAAQGK